MGSDLWREVIVGEIVLAETGRKNHTRKITCKNHVLGVLIRTKAVPDGL
jgi:hypothetical protein